MWVEVVVDYWERVFPVKRKGRFWWFVKRLSFLSVFWLTSLLVYTLSGIPEAYLYHWQLHLAFFGTGLIIFGSASGFRSFIKELPEWARPVLKLDEVRFKEFFAKAERWASSLFPPLLYAFAMILMNIVTSNLLFLGFTVLICWELALLFFMQLLSGTGIWIVVSIWLIVFQVSRQPLDLKLSSQTSRTFKPLATVSLYAAAFVFLTLSVNSVILPPAFLLSQLIYGFFILFGVLAFLIPFYNIHLLLIRLKKSQLQRISGETIRLIEELNGTLGQEHGEDSRHRIAIISARLLALHIEEKTVEEADEWPVDISFFSTIAGLGLMSGVRLVIDIVTRMLL